TAGTSRAPGGRRGGWGGWDTAACPPSARAGPPAPFPGDSPPPPPAPSGGRWDLPRPPPAPAPPGPRRLLRPAAAPRHARLPAEEPVGALAGGGAELLAKRGVAQQEEQPLHEAVGRRRIADEAALPVGHQLGNRSAVGGDNGHTRGHRLDHAEAEAFHGRREQEHVHETEVRGFLRLGDVAGEDHAALEPEPAGVALEIGPQGAAA